jgi:hypothetical protein
MAKEVGGDLETTISEWTEEGVQEGAAGYPGGDLEESEASRQTLTPKALDLMAKIAEYGYLTMHEVQFVFGNKTWGYKVMKGLRALGLVADFETLMSPKTGHHLTAKGYRVLAKFDRLKVDSRFAPERYNLFIFRHRMACAKVGLLLERHPLVHDFLAESRLWKRRKKDTDKVCDGEFWYQVPGDDRAERVGLEVELNLKNAAKMDESFQQLHRRRDLDQVWWICGDENVRRGLRREVLHRPGLAPQRHFFALLGEFLAARDKAEMMEPRGTLLSIDPDKPTLLPRPPEPPPAPSPALSLLTTPQPVEAARAEAPKPPEPARPAPMAPARPHWVLRALTVVWQWIKDSWVKEIGYDWRPRWRFQRWSLAAVLLALSVIGTGGYYLLRFPWLIECVKALEFPAWRTRKLSAPTYSGNGWLIEAQSLRSFGGLYRLKVFIVNRTRQARDLKWVRVHDDHKNLLGRRDFERERISPDFGVIETFEFQASIALRKFRLILAHGERPEVSVIELKFK